MQEFSDHGTWSALAIVETRALRPSKKTILQDAEPYPKFRWAGACATNWYFVLCSIDPRLQQRGCGCLLTRWGVERAKEEGIPASVIASAGSTGFYLKCGFDNVMGSASPAAGEASPMSIAQVKGGTSYLHGRRITQRAEVYRLQILGKPATSIDLNPVAFLI